MSSSQFTEFTQPGQKPVVNSIFDFSAEALGQLRLWFEQNPPAIGISNILGFSQFTAQPATLIATNESTTSITYTDLATVGPTLTGIPDGKYVIMYGAVVGISVTTDAAVMSPSINGVAASNSDALQSFNVDRLNLIGPVLTKSLANAGNNSLTMKYRSSSGGTAQFGNRWLLAIRYANI